ncbi:MAG: 50S ribosomal protein L13 [Chloroflexi bacterium]|nr:50S ribosomal protein L13 [Chloroflexota bacterium]
MKTYSTKLSDVKRTWHVIDATGRTLGRLATEVARLLKGKHKTIYAPHFDTGDYVVVINARKVRVSGKKALEKPYYYHSGYSGGLRTVTYAEMMEKFPDRIIKHAVKGMLPHNRLGRDIMARLKVYAGDEHPHKAQVNAGARPAKEEAESSASLSASEDVQAKGG